MIFGGLFFTFILPRYYYYYFEKKCSPEKFGIKTKRLSEFSNEGTFLHALELSIGSIRVATIVPVAVR